MLAMWADGKSARQIIVDTGLTRSSVYRIVAVAPRERDTMAKWMRAGWAGTAHHITPDAVAIVMKNIRGNETIISCLSRLVVQMSDQIEVLEAR